MSGGGCPAIVAVAEGKYSHYHCFVAHAGRESVLDRRRILGEGPSREHEGVVFALAEEFRGRGIHLRDVALFSFFALEGGTFGHPHEHPVHKVYNRRMSAEVLHRWQGAITMGHEGPDECGYLDIGKLIELQAGELGFGKVHITGTLTHNGPFAHTRHANPNMRKERNLVVVCRQT